MAEPADLGPGFGDFGCAALFGLGGIISVSQSLQTSAMKGLSAAIVCGAFTAIFIDGIYVKLRRVDTEAAPIKMHGRVDIHVFKTRAVVTATILIIFGPAWLGWIQESHPFTRWIGFVFTGLGLWLSFRLIKGWRRPTKFIRFDEAAYTIGKNPFRMSFAWDNIASARVAAFKGKAILLLELRDAGAVAVEPPSKRATWDAIVAHNRKTWGADVSSDTEDFGYGAPQMAATIRRYVEQPEARAELA